ncbi:hypothetical protein V1527DRAFT_462377 [Lipomyces starkeyi]
MRRRPHKKSRIGCIECKRRHIKCDESRPTCVNCSTVERSCSYFNKDPTSSVSTRLSHGTNHSTSSPEASVIMGKNFAWFAVQQSDDELPVNMNHLELLLQFLTETFKFSGIDQNGAEITFQVTIKYGLSAPCLMHEILALAALHLSIVRPEKQQFYRHQAALLQTRALSLFNRAKTDITADNCVPMFLFSTFLGVHVLCDTLRFRDNNFNVFLDRFVSYLHLHRGVRAITNRSWHLLRETELKPILEAAESLPQTKEGIGRECYGLQLLIMSADLSPSVVNACQQAIVHLQWVFDGQGTQPEGNPNVIFAWPVLVSAEYADLLMQRTPEALIILAYYAVLLYYRREIWVFGDAGKFLIESITRHLGTYYKKWLAWPNSVLVAASQPAS